MDSSQLAWVITIIVAVLLILGLVLFFGRRRKQAKDLERAEELRKSAADDERDAREGEAKAARAAAEAQQADIDAERLREEAQAARSRAQEQVIEAESLDPNVKTTERDSSGAYDARQDDAVDPNQTEPPRRSVDGKDTRGEGFMPS